MRIYGMQNDDRFFAIHSSTISSDTIYDLQISLNHGFQQIGDTLGDKKWLSDLFVKAQERQCDLSSGVGGMQLNVHNAYFFIYNFHVVYISWFGALQIAKI